MPYVERTVVAGLVRETRKMYTGRVHTQGATRSKNTGKTTAAQAKTNERKAEELLRWKLNGNFTAGDYHLVLHYYDKAVELEQAEADKAEFLRLARKEYRSRGVPWKYVACTETKRMTNVHHHIIMPAIDLAALTTAWERVVGQDVGNISVKHLDRRGNHKKLAHYLMKETRSTMERHREDGKRYKRFTCAQGMDMPTPSYTVVAAGKWAEDPKPKKGYTLLKDDDGDTARSGVHEANGWPWQEYFELWTGDGDPPGSRRKKRRRKTP